jgi:glycosyltransferase involved in cell wall biosynthesis
MPKIHRKVSLATKKAVNILRTEGPLSFSRALTKYTYYRAFPNRKKKHLRDILFVNGCTLDHPSRYRVQHQLEQLRASGLSTDSVFYDRLNQDLLKYYRGFVFFRCPVTDGVKEFIEAAKKANKVCFFDIDDLVIDQKYTDQIEYVKNMSKSEKEVYNDGVNRMRETLLLCDYAITTTEVLQQELTNYLGEVFINRNVASDEMVSHSMQALNGVTRDADKVVIGYFSGSITHNPDFELVLPSLVKLLQKYSNVYIKLAGIIDVPAELAPYQNRLLNIPFMNWRKMPHEIASCDINLAPITPSIFNEAKSENKWTEASLVGVVTAASNRGAFKKVISHGQTGILVNDTDWYQALEELILQKEKRETIGSDAHKMVLRHHTTISTAPVLAEFINSKLARNIGFILPSTDISGGTNVVLKHAEILQNNGWDVTLIDVIDKAHLRKSQRHYQYRLTIPGYNVVTAHKIKVESYFDTMVATLWSTVAYVKKYPNVVNRSYFVQNYETDFYLPGVTTPRMEATATYYDQANLKYLTMSVWCKKWLKDRFGKEAKYSSNGIDLHNYPVRNRDFSKPKIKLLIEGDSSSEYKNTDEAFRIVSRLDPDKFEVSYLSYRKEPKDWYRVDHFYNRIAPEKVGEVYASCDILIKTSLLESFSYPPLEMMATGGLCVVLPNDGNIEYLRDGSNCLFYRPGDIDDALEKIDQLITNEKLRNALIAAGLETARKYEWKNLEKDVQRLYD